MYLNIITSVIIKSKMLLNVAWNAIMQPHYHVTDSYVRVMWMQ